MKSFRKSKKTYQYIWLPNCISEEGHEIELDGEYYVIKAILKDRIIGDYGGGYIESYVLIQFVETVTDRLKREVSELRDTVSVLRRDISHLYSTRKNYSVKVKKFNGPKWPIFLPKLLRRRSRR